MYGTNFAYFDPNIWWNEDEMRKQIEKKEEKPPDSKGPFGAKTVFSVGSTLHF